MASTLGGRVREPTMADVKAPKSQPPSKIKFKGRVYEKVAEASKAPAKVKYHGQVYVLANPEKTT